MSCTSIKNEKKLWEAEASLAKDRINLKSSDNAKIDTDSEGNNVIKILMINGHWAEYDARKGIVEE